MGWFVPRGCGTPDVAYRYGLEAIWPTDTEGRCGVGAEGWDGVWIERDGRGGFAGRGTWYRWTMVGGGGAGGGILHRNIVTRWHRGLAQESVPAL